MFLKLENVQVFFSFHVASSFICTFLKQSTSLKELSLNHCRGILTSKIAEGLKASSSIFSLDDTL